MKAWITKYALTAGIQEVEGEYSRGMLTVRIEREGHITFPQHYHNSEWHSSKEAAIAEAEKMRQKRVASLKKSLAAMEKLSFT